MKRYKLLKDLPFAKAGTVFTRNTFKSKDGLSDYDYLETHILLDGDQDETCFNLQRNYFINNFDEWFEEVKEPKICFTIDFYKSKVKEINTDHYSGWSSLEIYIQEEAEKYLEYLKAKAIIKQDTKGFKPDWNIVDGKKYYGIWDFEENKPDWRIAYTVKGVDIYFENWEDINESIKKHPKEWKTYLTYEQ